MIFRICMPKIDANIDEGTVGHWIKSPGERYEKGDPLLEIITDKATFEFEAEQAGLLRRILAEPRSTVPVGYVLALASETQDEPLPDVSVENAALVTAWRRKGGLAAPARAAPPAPAGADRPEGPRVRATPAARRLARQHGLDLARIPNPEDRVISEHDVMAFIAAREGEEAS